MIKSFFFIVLLVLFMVHLFAADYSVQRVDFLTRYGLTVNGAGPILVKVDSQRNRILLINTYTSSVSIVDGSNHSVKNIPVKNRIPQYLKDEAFTINQKTGDLYVIGKNHLHIVFPEKNNSLSVDTVLQYEMVAVNDNNGDAYLVGRSSKYLAIFELKSKKMKTVKWVDKVEDMVNLNQTPPPPIRKVVWDNRLNRIIVTDGFASTLCVFSPRGKMLFRRPIKTRGGARWHYAGYNPDSHHLYVVVETSRRKVIEAIKIDVKKNRDVVVGLPELSEAVGVNYDPSSDRIIIPYDNHPVVHAVSFGKGNQLGEIKVPTYGNDASAVDIKNQLLFVASWAYGEINIIDLKQNRLKKRVRNLGIIPHMFSMDFNPVNGKLYFPIGATAVNGSFGSAITAMDTVSLKADKIYTGWAPVDLVSVKDRDSFLIFNAEDEFAEVKPDGSCTFFKLPVDFPRQAVLLDNGYIYLSYGPHQSYWPVVYIWGAKNGILGINPKTFEFYDRRIPRLAQQMVLDKMGVLYALQNNWGGEKQFLISLPDTVRSPNQGDMRIELGDRVDRETTQRILKYDSDKNWLYIVRLGEQDTDPGIFQIYDLNTNKELLNYPVGITPVDLIYDEKKIYISNFDSDTVAEIDKDDFSVKRIKTGKKPFKLGLQNNNLFIINHLDNSLQVLGPEAGTFVIPFKGRPDNLFCTDSEVFLAHHSTAKLNVIVFNPEKKKFSLIVTESYPFGETSVDTNNTAFYIRGQFGDALFEINQIKVDKTGRVWITDYLSGKLFILEKK
jgi:DNA-binding beta-propeller fold protein YncE